VCHSSALKRVTAGHSCRGVRASEHVRKQTGGCYNRLSKIRHLSFDIRHSAVAGGGRHLPCFLPTCVQSSSSVGVVTSAKDITFACSHCKSPLVVDAAAAGMTLPCQRCGKPTLVPASAPKPSRAAAQPDDRTAELRRQLKENESQRTEVTGYINQLSIQLHRWQLRLQTLEERRQQLENELHGGK
jgi:hypothetical protein